MTSSTGFFRVFFSGIQGMFIAVMLAIGFLWLVGWTGFFISIQSMAITPDGTTLVRSTPFGDVTANWVMEITPPDGRECYPAIGKSVIQQQKDDTVRLPIPEALQHCAVMGAVVRVAYSVEFFGFPLRPVRVTRVIGE